MYYISLQYPTSQFQSILMGSQLPTTNITSTPLNSMVFTGLFWRIVYQPMSIINTDLAFHSINDAEYYFQHNILPYINHSNNEVIGILDNTGAFIHTLYLNNTFNPIINIQHIKNTPVTNQYKPGEALKAYKRGENVDWVKLAKEKFS